VTTWLIIADDARFAGLLELAAALPAPVRAVVVGPRELAEQVAGWVASVSWYDTASVPAAGLADAVSTALAADPGWCWPAWVATHGCWPEP
jgi:hypothetical protein